jgi:hypothetical protein
LAARLPSPSPSPSAALVEDLSVEREDEVNSAVRGHGFGRRILVEKDLVGQCTEQPAVHGEIAAVLSQEDVHPFTVAVHHCFDLDVLSPLRHGPRIDVPLEIHAEALEHA